MNLSHNALLSLADPTWINDYITKMGEPAFWQYKHKLYAFLDKLEVGQTISVEAWAKPETVDLFIKIVCCYISESECCYQINPEYTIIKRNFDAQQMERTLTLLACKRQAKGAAPDGSGTECERKGPEAVPAPAPVV